MRGYLSGPGAMPPTRAARPLTNESSGAFQLARKPNYDFEKRRKELERKAKQEAKQEEKRRRREEQAAAERADPATTDEGGVGPEMPGPLPE